MDSLEKIALIKSAKFDFAEISLDGNSLFIGANGAGKTTLLRAILYFYTADARTLGINSNKKISFNDYYFEYENSYIAYVYKKNDKYILVTVYKDSSVKFRFCLLNEMPDLQSIYTEGNKPIEPANLWIKLKDLGILSSIQNSGEYKKILYSRNHKLNMYSLFEAKDYDGFVKTLSNIFVNSKVDSEAIKKVLVSSLDINKKIEIDQIKRYLENFNTSFEDIETFHKSQTDIKKILSSLDEYEQIKHHMQENFSTLFSSKEITKKEILSLDENLSKIHTQTETLKKQQNYEDELFSKREGRLKEKAGALKENIKSAKDKNEHYQKQDIDNKILLFNSINFLEEDLKIVSSKKDFLTKEHKEIKENHQNQIQKIQNNFDAKSNFIKEKEVHLNTLLQGKKQTILVQENEALDKLKKNFDEKTKELREKKHTIELQKQEIKHKQQNISNDKFTFVHVKKLEQYLQNKKELELKILTLKKGLDTKNKELEFQKDFFEKELKSISNIKNIELKKISNEIGSIEKLLNPNKNSLISKIYENSSQKDKYLYFLKDEVLQSDINVAFGEQSSKIFEFDTLKFEAPKNSLNAKLESLKSSYSQTQKELSKDIEKTNNSLRNLENSIYREKRAVNEALKENGIELITLKTKITTLQNQEKALLLSFEQEQKDKLESLHVELKNLNLIFANCTDNELKINDEKAKEIKATKTSFTKLLNPIEDEFVRQFNELQANIKELILFKNDELKNQEDLYSKLLQKSGIDTEKLTEFQEQEKNLLFQIKTIREYETIIIEYKKDKREIIDLQKTNEKELINLKEELQNLLEIHQKTSEELNKQHDDLLQEKSSINTQLELKKEHIKSVHSFENGSTFERCLKLGIKYFTNDDYQDIAQLLQNISNLTTSYSNSENRIYKYIAKLSFIFDNSLNIKKELNPIASAYTLKEFYKSNKIEYYKDLLSNNLNQIVKSIIEQHDNLLSSQSKIESLVNKITKLFKEIHIGVIDSISLRYSRSNNKIIESFNAIKTENDENALGYNLNLFNTDSKSDTMIKLLKKLSDIIDYEAVDKIELEDSFVLEFRVVENGNDSRYQNSLDMIGSNGTDVIVKSMIYIAMLHIFKEKTTKKELIIHVILDEIGILSQKYLKELIEFANKYGIFFINGAPDEKLIGTYKRVNLISNIQNISVAKELILK